MNIFYALQKIDIYNQYINEQDDQIFSTEKLDYEQYGMIRELKNGDVATNDSSV